MQMVGFCDLYIYSISGIDVNKLCILALYTFTCMSSNQSVLFELKKVGHFRI